MTGEPMDYIAVIVALVAAVGTIGKAIYDSRNPDVISRASATLLEEMRKELAERDARIDKLEAQAATDKAQIASLTCELGTLRQELAKWQAVVEILSNQIISDGKRPLAGPKSS